MDSKFSDKAVENKQSEPVPYIAFESVQARNERNIKRLWITVIALIALLFASNMIWLGVFAGFDFADYEVTADGGSEANYASLIGGDMDGDIYNGSKSTSEDENKADGLSGQNDEG